MSLGNFFVKYKNQDWSIESFKADGAGLSDAEAKKRLNLYGTNEIHKNLEKFFLFDYIEKFFSPLILILIVIAIFSFFFGDKVSTVVLLGMIFMSVTLSFIQESRAQNAAKKLGEMVQTTCSVVRGGKTIEIPLKMVVPGDLVVLSAGDIIPGDIRIISSKDLFINESPLTGESFPVEKNAEKNAVAFMGTSVVSGIGSGIVVFTRLHTSFGKISQKLSEAVGPTLFEKQVNDFTSAMLKIIVLVILVIMSVYSFQYKDMMKSFMFALAVAVQITPETLPMILTLNLSRGAVAMSRKKAIVKRLNSIQNLGAMDVLCSDKTGTLTINEVVLERHIDINGKEDESVFMFGYINSFYQTGIKNIFNEAVLKHEREDLHEYVKIDEIPFDFERKINSVIVKNSEEIFISVGAPEEIIKRCSRFQDGLEIKLLLKDDYPRILNQYLYLSGEGFRVLAVANKIVDSAENYDIQNEKDLIFKGYMAFLDPPKLDVKKDIDDLREAGISFKIVTGDNEYVTKKICKDLGINVEGIILGTDLEKMPDLELAELVGTTTIFARVTPEQKERIIKSLKSKGHTVGYLGDGINDALSLRAADVGISVNNAVDIAKESAGIVLLEKNLGSLVDGVKEGRKVFGNFMKYIRMTSMVNVGYMMSTIGASFFLPFVPMIPVQMLLNNYLYEVGQTTIPGDSVDSQYFKNPRRWSVRSLVGFLLSMGMIISLFDFITFYILLTVFNGGVHESVFQNGWFIHTMLVQMLLIFIIRTSGKSFFENKPRVPMVLLTLTVLGLVFVLPLTSLAIPFNLIVMPKVFYPIEFSLVLVELLVIWRVKNLIYDIF